MARWLKTLFFILTLSLPLQAYAEEEVTEAQLRQESVAKLKESIKKTQRDMPVKGGISDWNIAGDGSENSQPNAFTMLKGLAICIGIFLIGISILQRIRKRTSGSNAEERRLKIVERVTLTSKTALVLAELDGKSVLMSVGNDKVTFYPDRESGNSNKTALADFAEVYKEEEVSA